VPPQSYARWIQALLAGTVDRSCCEGPRASKRNEYPTIPGPLFFQRRSMAVRSVAADRALDQPCGRDHFLFGHLAHFELVVKPTQVAPELTP